MTDQDTILVTGAAGYIASWVVAYALQTGAKVRGTVRGDCTPNNKRIAHLFTLPGAAERLELVQLDLLASTPEQFASAVNGCTLVAHTASPFPSTSPKHEDDLIKPAVEGTLSVLRACLGSSTVRSVVVTSSVASCSPEDSGRFGEADWTNTDKAGAYSKSKTLAERAAWDLYKAENPKWSLCTINPGFVLGPSLSNDKSGTSTETAMRLLDGSLPMVPKVAFGCVDVRDVARAHIRALTLDKDLVQGRRFIACGESYWMKDMCDALRPKFAPAGYPIPKFQAPYAMLWLYSWIDASAALILPLIGKMAHYDSTPSREVLKIEYTAFNKTMEDTAHSLIFHGILARKPGYSAPSADWTPLTS